MKKTLVLMLMGLSSFLLAAEPWKQDEEIVRTVAVAEERHLKEAVEEYRKKIAELLELIAMEKENSLPNQARIKYLEASFKSFTFLLPQLEKELKEFDFRERCAVLLAEYKVEKKKYGK